MSAESNPNTLGISRTALWFGILAAPFAWSAHELFSYLFASHLCRLRAEGLSDTLVHPAFAPFVVVTVLTVALALAGAWTAVVNWRKGRAEQRDSSLDLGEIGTERTRFLARCGLINTVLFITAFLFTLADLVVAPLCGR